MTTDVQPKRFAFLGGALALDFTNTVDWHDGPAPSDRLRDYSDLADWAREAGVLTLAEADAVKRRARQEPAQAAEALRRTILVRESLFRIFRAVADGSAPAERDLAILNGEIPTVFSDLRLESTPEGFRWGWAPDARPFDLPLRAVIRSATDLLVSAQREHVRMCGGQHCGWLFLDTTRNKRRRWCSMDDCGNREKARRFYQRHKAGD